MLQEQIFPGQMSVLQLAFVKDCLGNLFFRQKYVFRQSNFCKKNFGKMSFLQKEILAKSFEVKFFLFEIFLIWTNVARKNIAWINVIVTVGICLKRSQEPTFNPICHGPRGPDRFMGGAKCPDSI